MASKFITQAIANGTKVTLNIPGASVDKVMVKLRRNKLRCVRECSVFMFYSRKTGSLVDSRIN